MILKQGKGWRLGWNPDVSDYPGLIGSETWAFELTAEELNDFCRLLGQLAESITAIAAELMEEERISCEVESENLWLGAEGYAEAYSLRLILNKRRGCEGNWSEIAVAELVQACQLLTVF